MNIKEKNQSFKTVIQFFRNTSSLITVFNLFNSSQTYNISSSGTLNLDEYKEKKIFQNKLQSQIYFIKYE